MPPALFSISTWIWAHTGWLCTTCTAANRARSSNILMPPGRDARHIIQITTWCTQTSNQWSSACHFSDGQSVVHVQQSGLEPTHELPSCWVSVTLFSTYIIVRYYFFSRKSLLASIKGNPAACHRQSSCTIPDFSILFFFRSTPDGLHYGICFPDLYDTQATSC